MGQEGIVFNLFARVQFLEHTFQTRQDSFGMNER